MIRKSGHHGIQLHKNNTGNSDASHGCDENYLMRRSTPFADMARSRLILNTAESLISTGIVRPREPVSTT